MRVRVVRGPTSLRTWLTAGWDAAGRGPRGATGPRTWVVGVSRTRRTFVCAEARGSTCSRTDISGTLDVPLDSLSRSRRSFQLFSLSRPACAQVAGRPFPPPSAGAVGSSFELAPAGTRGRWWALLGLAIAAFMAIAMLSSADADAAVTAPHNIIAFPQ